MNVTQNEPVFYTTPEDWKKCQNYRDDGPTPCWHPHCDCFKANGEKWDRRMLELAATAASWSKDPSTRVGAVIVRPDRTICSLGFNGFPRGMSDSTEYYADRETKYSRIVHAEMNAILNAHGPVAGHTLYSTMFPCSNCALIIIQAGIKRVVANLSSMPLTARWQESFDRTKNFFSEAGVEALVYP